MNKLISVLKAIVLIFVFSACTGNEINEDCYTCENTATTYCINQGDDFYLEIPTNGTPTTVPLNGEFWSDIKVTLEQECGNGPQLDCYTCELTSTMYCYLPGNTFYTSSVDNAAATQINLNNQTWEEIKANLQDECVDSTQDCYTCVSEATQYCYTEGADFYTSTVNNNETQVPLNGQTWAEVRTGLEENCPTVITASLVGNWQINDFHGTTVSNTTIAGQTTTIESTQNAITHEAYVSFSENPNEYDGNGFITIESVTNGQTTTYESTPFESGSWVLEGNELFLDGATANPGVILELSNTTLTIKYDQTIVSEDNGVTTETILDFTQSYTRL